MVVATINATAFKAKCLDLLDQLAAHRLERLEVTKRGRVVAVVLPPGPAAMPIAELHGFMRGSAILPPDVDLAAAADEAWDAEMGVLHR